MVNTNIKYLLQYVNLNPYINMIWKSIVTLYTLLFLIIQTECSLKPKLKSFDLTPHKNLLVLYIAYRDGDDDNEEEVGDQSSGQNEEQDQDQEQQQQQDQDQEQQMKSKQNKQKQRKIYTKVNFKIDFNSSEIVIDRRYAHRQIFLDKSLKFSLKNLAHVQSKNIKKQIDKKGNDQKQQIQGHIGFQPHSPFFQALKSSLKVQHIQLWIKLSEKTIQIVQSNCINPIFPPYQLQIQTLTRSQSIQIKTLSFQFSAHSHKFLSLLDKQSNPFTITPSKLSQKINIQFVNQIQTISLKSLIMDKCMKVSGSENYQCDILQQIKSKAGKQVDDFGKLLMQFDPIICTDKAAIELMREGKIDSIGYYWAHVLLIFVELGLVVVFKYRHILQRKIACYIKGQKNH